MTLAGCATHVSPPVRPSRPTAVYLCDYGVHSSLLLPSGDDRYVEYNYGDWDFAAMNKTDPWHTLVALFDSHQACLGRRFVTSDSPQEVPIPPNKPHSIQGLLVDRRRVETLEQTLDDRYRQNIQTAYLNTTQDYFFTFVKDPLHYSLENNCNTLTGQDLEALGCQISGSPIVSDFRVNSPTVFLKP